MSQDEKPSGKFQTAPSSDTEPDAPPESIPKSSHKVIADIHSGMVMVAPVATTLSEDDEHDDEHRNGDGTAH